MSDQAAADGAVTQWAALWPEALRAWGRFVAVHPPMLCETGDEARAAGLTGSFAMFRLDDRTVVLDLAALSALGLSDLGLEVLAHEVGHHVLCPADLADNGRLLARVRRGLPELERHAPMVANLYADLLVNDRLQRSRGLRMDEVYRRMPGPASPLWSFYMRVYEILWALPTGTLTPRVAADVDADAQLGARLARVYAADWLAGAGGFAMLCYRYLTDAEALVAFTCRSAVGADAQVPGLALDDDGPLRHPAFDPLVNDFTEPPAEEPELPSGGQYREPFEYGQILRQLGVDVSDEDAATRYYRERAAPHLVPFPTRERPVVREPLPEGTAAWDVGEPLDRVDWLATALRSPHVVPGVTTEQRVMGWMDGQAADPEPVDLDLYVDSSGSMPDPRRTVSYLTLAGAILALSALRVGARVQATLWSGTRQVLRTDGFVRDEQAVLRVLTGFFGGGTAFPLPVLRDTYLEPRRPTHIVVISDNGVDTMIKAVDERGRPGGDIAASALAAAGAGGTLLLNLWSDAEEARIAALTPGWDLHRVADWADLVDFAAAFGRRAYERSPG
ncbi:MULTISPECIES: VWA domain-containing protein [Actinokineospora]|uniref:VWA domain-containing protein n=1 Tax=Actinokineospora fastidiosa TaxID=1816 RepID=A0A918GG89_9PSEU|nr:MULTISPECIES: VWA domain-containing protein [Actinokineospora]UVS80308.1 hypothetical protein Actkin_04058 [Actinokineospora sp. UTMC 2448]GGS34372.1 hypothetical protein GCM10010171_30990 [Actinokineospora fastidiosa]